MHSLGNKHQKCCFLREFFIIISHGFLFPDTKARAKEHIWTKKKKISANGTSVSVMLHSRHLSDRGRTDGYMILLLLQQKIPLVLMSYKLSRGHQGAAPVSFCSSLKAHFRYRPWYFRYGDENNKKATWKREAMNMCRKTRQEAASWLFILQLKPSATKPDVRGHCRK
jgi:hypothetical protein